MSDLHARVAALLPSGVRVVVAPLDAEDRFRHAAEAEAVQRAVPKRRRAFATGRRLAHEALDGLGVADAPLLPADDRAPLWPTGVVGSIAHDESLCVVALADAARFRSLGVDVEPAEPAEERLHGTIMSDVERAALPAEPGARDLRARLVFVVKEAVYKALAPHVRVVLEFHDVHAVVHGSGRDGGAFTARLQRDDLAWSPAEAVHGRWCEAGGHLFAAVALPRG